MSVKVIPYIDNKITKQIKTTVTADQSTTSAVSGADTQSFQETLATAERAQQALSVDALLSASNAGGISPELIQKLLGFNPAPGVAAANAKMTTSQGTASTKSANSSSAAQTAGSTAGSSDGLTCSAELDIFFAEAAQKYGVDVKLLKAIAKAESNFNPNATSSAGAMGVMQLMPATAAGLGISDAYNAYDNIMGGAQIISQNLAKYNGDLSLALAAYNAGSGNVDKYGGIPPFEETQNYVKKVLAYYNA